MVASSLVKLLDVQAKSLSSSDYSDYALPADLKDEVVQKSGSGKLVSKLTLRLTQARPNAVWESLRPFANFVAKRLRG
jgi:hypothetical protein